MMYFYMYSMLRYKKLSPVFYQTGERYKSLHNININYKDQREIFKLFVLYFFNIIYLTVFPYPQLLLYPSHFHARCIANDKF